MFFKDISAGRVNKFELALVLQFCMGCCTYMYIIIIHVKRSYHSFLILDPKSLAGKIVNPIVHWSLRFHLSFMILRLGSKKENVGNLSIQYSSLPLSHPYLFSPPYNRRKNSPPSTFYLLLFLFFFVR